MPVSLYAFVCFRFQITANGTLIAGMSRPLVFSLVVAILLVVCLFSVDAKPKKARRETTKEEQEVKHTFNFCVIYYVNPITPERCW